MMIESVDLILVDIVERVMEFLNPKAREKNVALMSYISPEVPFHLRGDPVRVRQVLMNLVGNAIKFTPKGEITVKVSLEHEDDEQIVVRFAVRDTGIGLSEVARKRLFQPFTQADGGTTRRYGGTGLGLVISKRLAELMRGIIGVDSEEGQGSTFWFTARFEHASQPLMPAVRNNLHGIRVLVVDDSPQQREIVSHILSGWSIQVDAAESGEEALQILDRYDNNIHPFDAAIIDVAMPGMDGFTLAGHIREIPALRDLRLVFLTAFDTPEQRQQAAAMGAAYLTKPTRQSILFEALATIRVAQAPPNPRPRSTTNYLNRPLILVAEDNLMNQALTIQQLSHLGYAGEVASNGLAVLQALEQSPGRYVLVLMDVQMPEMDGYQTTQAIRALETATDRHQVIIAMTANAMQGDREKCLAAGMDDYLSKPVSMEILGSKLAEWINIQ